MSRHLFTRIVELVLAGNLGWAVRGVVEGRRR